MERAQQQNLDGIGTKTNAVADRETPLLKSHWYVAAFSEEVTREPMRRTILDQDIVFYRTEAGTAVAVQNRCPHRSFPLHLGTLDGDRIVCGYHGIEFNPDGSCASVPALNIAPRSICLDAYALVEEGPLLWIWMGGDTEPDYSRLFQQEWSSSEAWAYEKGYMYMEASYLGLHENLMDLTHFPFLHGVLGIFRPKTTRIAESPAIRGLPGGITFPEPVNIPRLCASVPPDPVVFHSFRRYRYPSS